MPHLFILGICKVNLLLPCLCHRQSALIFLVCFSLSVPSCSTALSLSMFPVQLCFLLLGLDSSIALSISSFGFLVAQSFCWSHLLEQSRVLRLMGAPIHWDWEAAGSVQNITHMNCVSISRDGWTNWKGHILYYSKPVAATLKEWDVKERINKKKSIWECSICPRHKFEGLPLISKWFCQQAGLQAWLCYAYRPATCTDVTVMLPMF